MKNRIKRLFAALLAGALLLSAAGCVQTKDQNGSSITSSSVPPTAEASQQEQFDAYLDESFDEVAGDNLMDSRFILRYPEKRGLTNIPKTIGDMGLDEEDNRAQEWQDDYDELTAFKYDELTEDQQFIYDLIMDQLKQQETVKHLSYYDEPNSPLLGVQSGLPSSLQEFYFYTIQDVYDYIEVLGSVPAFFDEMLQYQRSRSEKGLFMTDDIADEVIKSCTNFTEPKENMLVTTFEKRITDLEGMTDSEKAKLIELNKNAITEKVIPAYNGFVEGIKSLKGTGKNDKGMYYLPEGRTYYEYMVLSGTGADRSVAQMAQMIERRIFYMYGGLSDILSENPDILNQYEATKIKHNDPVECLNLLRERSAAQFPELEVLEYNVKYVDPSMEEHSSPAFYYLPQVDATEPNSIYINRKDISEGTNMKLFPTMAHEGYPGHMYQNNYFWSQKPHPIRRFLGSSGYAEGWANYVESLSYEMADIEDPNIVWLFQFDGVMGLMIQSRVDIGVNYEGWEKEKVGEYLSQFGMDTPENIDSIFSAVIKDPANSLKYCVGQLEFEELRTYAMDELAGNFDEKEFHRVVLDIGPAPFSFIRDAVEKHVSEVKTQNGLQKAA